MLCCHAKLSYDPLSRAFDTSKQMLHPPYTPLKPLNGSSIVFIAETRWWKITTQCKSGNTLVFNLLALLRTEPSFVPHPHTPLHTSLAQITELYPHLCSASNPSQGFHAVNFTPSSNLSGDISRNSSSKLIFLAVRWTYIDSPAGHSILVYNVQVHRSHFCWYHDDPNTNHHFEAGPKSSIHNHTGVNSTKCNPADSHLSIASLVFRKIDLEVHRRSR